jgi:hypothetical protein
MTKEVVMAGNLVINYKVWCAPLQKHITMKACHTAQNNCQSSEKASDSSEKCFWCSHYKTACPVNYENISTHTSEYALSYKMDGDTTVVSAPKMDGDTTVVSAPKRDDGQDSDKTKNV